MDPLWPLTASPFLNLHHNPHPLQKGFLFHFWVTVFGWCTPKTVATEQQRRKTAHIKPTEFQTALNSVCWGWGGRLRAGNHSQPRPHGSEPPLHLQYYFANSKEPFLRTAPSRWAGEKEWRWKWKEPMLQLKKSGSSTDKVFPVCICVDCDMNGDVSLLTYSTKTENERCNTGGERIQWGTAAAKHTATWSTVPVR